MSQCAAYADPAWAISTAAAVHVVSSVPAALRVVVGVVAGLAYLGVFLEIGRRSFGTSTFPTLPPRS